MSQRTLAVLTALFLGGEPGAAAPQLRIAVIYPKDDPKVSSIGNEAACITEGLLAEAKKAGAPIDYRFFDNERDPIKTVSVAEAIAKDKFDLAIGTVTSSEAIAAAKILNSAKIPFFATTATNPDVTKDKPYSFRLPFDDYHQAQTLALFVAKEQRAKKVAVVRNISLPYSEFLAVEFSSHLKTLDPKVVIDQFDIIEGFSQYGALVDKIVASKAEVTFVPIYAPDVAKLYNELATRPGKFSLLGGDTVGGRDSFFKVLKGTSQNVSLVFVKSWADGPEGPEKDAFLKAHAVYCKDQNITLVSAAAYDVVRASLLGVKKDGNARELKLISVIKSLGYNGLTGIFKHKRNGEPEKPLFLHKIENDRSSYWKRYP
jgi:branched-chain amino acid transport system substrate-binding protein